MKVQKSTLHVFQVLTILFLVSSVLLHAENKSAISFIDQDDSSRFNHTISGSVTRLPDSVPFEGVVIVFSEVGTATVDEDGFYTMQAPRNWSGTATPQFGDGSFYDFSPAQYTYTNLKFDQFDKDFAGEANTLFSITGQITDQDSGEPFANKTLSFQSLTPASPNRNIVTDDQGFYSIENLLPEYNYEFEPVYANFYYISPFTRNFTPLNSDSTGQDFTILNYEYPIPPEWQYTNSGFFHIISIEATSMPDICGRDLDIGDLIGVFYYDFNNVLKCAGYARWQDKTNMALVAQGDDVQTTPDIKEGFANGETMNWRIYSYSDEQAYPAQPTYKSGTGLSTNNKWQNMSLSIVQGIDGQTNDTVAIPSGWSGLSGYLAPQPATMATVMAPISDELIILQNLQGVYYPSGGINTIGNWAYNKGYAVKLEEAANLPFTGCPNANKTIGLATGWNLIPVLSKCDVVIDDLFAPVIDKISIIKEVAGTGIYWPAMGIQTLEIFNPGKAYYVAASQNAVITYQECDATKSQSSGSYVEPENTTTWNTPAKTPTTHVVAFSADISPIFSTDDFIGAFTENDVCAGFVKIQDKNTNYAVSVFGNDFSTGEQDGFDVDEMMKFKLFKSQSGQTFDLEIEYNTTLPSWDGKFQDNGLSSIKTMKLAATGIGETGQHPVMIYPNPTSESVTFSTKDHSVFFVTLQNLGGNIILQESVSGNRSFDLTNLSAGVYIVKIENRDLTTYEKLVLQ
jgi:hypothetical protein